MIERVPYYGWPKPTPTNAERIEAWRRKYALVPIEAQCTPIHRVGSPTRQGVPPAPTPYCRVGGLFFTRSASDMPGVPGEGIPQ